MGQIPRGGSGFLPGRVFSSTENSPTSGTAKLLSLPGGVKVYRGGDTYAVMREGGDIVNAQINSNAHNTWINVTVGVGGSARRNARGLLANRNGNVGELAARTGVVFAGNWVVVRGDFTSISTSRQLARPIEGYTAVALRRPGYRNKRGVKAVLRERSRAAAGRAGPGDLNGGARVK